MPATDQPDRLLALEEELRRKDAQLGEARQALEQHLQYYQSLVDAVPDGLLVTDPFGIILQANPVSAALFRCRRPFLVGKPLAAFIDPDHRRDFYGRFARLRAGEAVHEWHLLLRTPDRERVEVRARPSCIPDGVGELSAVRWMLRDITAELQTWENLQSREYLADLLIDTASAVIVLLDPRGRILRVNRHLEALTGFRSADLLGEEWASLIVPAGGTNGANHIATLVTRDGTARTIQWSVQPLVRSGRTALAELVIGQDITELRQRQEQAVRTERLAAIGEMVAGLAHESRNALQRGNACLERLRWMLPDRPEALDLVARVQCAQDDLLRLYEDVRGYAVPIRLDCRECDLRAVWREAWDQLACQRDGRDAELIERIDGVDLHCTADEFQLAQVFRNIFENSLAACPDPVRIAVVCRETVLHGQLAIGVAVADNGPGLSAEQKRRMFEPFYTTKLRGTGLGMAIALRIVEKHGGRMNVGTPPEGGAEIVFTLPRRQS